VTARDVAGIETPVQRAGHPRPSPRRRTGPVPGADEPTIVLPPHDADDPTVELPPAVGGSAASGQASGGAAAGSESPTVVLGVVAPAITPDDPEKGSGRKKNGGVGDGLALSISSALGSLAGFLSWLLAARIMPQEEVGRASAVVSAFILIGGCAQLNINVGLLRWLPGAGRKAGRLVWGSLFLIMPLSALVGLVYVLIVPDLGATASGLLSPADGSIGVGVLLFVLACAGWAVFVVHDFILVAMHRPWWTVWRNGLFAAARIGLLVALGTGLGAQGLVVSWVLPIVVWTVLGTLVIALLVRRFARRAEGSVLPSRREVVSFLGPTAVAQIGSALLYNQVTLLVTLRFGPGPGAAFFIVWQAVSVVDIAATFYMDSLAVQTAREPLRAAALARAAQRRMMVLFLPVLAIAIMLAQPVLLVFGPGYAEASRILQILMIGLVFRLVVVHELGVRQAAGAALAFSRLQLVNTLLVLAVVAVLPTPAAGTTTDSALLPIALGYVAVQVLSAAAVLVPPALRRRLRPEVKR
jgi:O-antigen/teichoic acid export membrane protein